jgi:hypothetical protein
MTVRCIEMAGLIAELEKLHLASDTKLISGVNVKVCEHCLMLCHSHSGLNCDEPSDGMWPCETMKIVERYK